MPEGLKYFRPLAVAGRLAANFPTRSKNVVTSINPQTKSVTQGIEQNPVTLSWGFTLQYNFQYLSLS